MKSSLMKRFSDFLFEVDDSKTLSQRVPVAAVPEVPTAPVIPPINMKPYLAARIIEAIPKMSHHRDQRERELLNLTEDTLVMMAATPRLKEFDADFLDRNKDEGQVRSILLLVDSERFAGTIPGGVEYAYQTLSKYHGLGFTDLSIQDGLTIDRVSAAVELIASCGDPLLTPPQLTYFAMQYPDKIDDIVAHVKEHYSEPSTFHLIDMDRLNEYVNSEHKALRDGLL